MKCVAWISSLALAAALLAGCKTKSRPLLEYMPDMYRQPSVRAQERDASTPGSVGMREPPAGTVPVGLEPYTLGLGDTTQADRILNPLPPTHDVLEAGRKYYNSYCIVCHGARGDGRGFVVPKFTMPPPLFSEKLMRWSDGRIYHITTLGQGLMSSYASQLLPEQRWAVVHYVRALQKAAHPTEQDLAAAKSNPLTLESDLPDTARAEPRAMNDE